MFCVVSLTEGNLHQFFYFRLEKVDSMLSDVLPADIIEMLGVFELDHSHTIESCVASIWYWR